MPQGAVMPHAYPLCHCEPVPFILSLSKDVAISFPSTPPAHPQPSCHCEERSDVAISMRLNTRLRTAVATATRLPRYAPNDRRAQDARGR